MVLSIFECMLYTVAILSGILVIFDVWESYTDDNQEIDGENYKKILNELSRQQFYLRNSVVVKSTNPYFH